MSIFLLKKILQSLVLPPLNSILIILCSLIYFKNKKISIIIIIFSIILLYIQSIPYTANYMAAWVELPRANIKQLSAAKAFVVLGGGVNNNSKEYETFAVSNIDTLARVRYAAYLAKQYPTTLIIVAGGAVDSRDSEASLMKQSLLKEFNVTNPIIIENKSRTTVENAQNVAKILKSLNLDNIIIITQAFHAKRSLALFERYGIQAKVAPTAYYSMGFFTMKIMWFIPNITAMAEVTNVLHEEVGYYYDLVVLKNIKKYVQH